MISLSNVIGVMLAIIGIALIVLAIASLVCVFFPRRYDPTVRLKKRIGMEWDSHDGPGR
jgi:Ni/Fe-hydrogenase subunit HybB-like protein